MAYTYNSDIVSDLHKDARGFRPTQYWWDQWDLCNDDQKQVMWDSLCKELEQEMAREKAAQDAALLGMHQRIQGLMLVGAKDEVQALKWIMEAEEFSDYDMQYGADYFCYHFGLNYNTKKDFPIQQAMNEMLSEVV